MSLPVTKTLALAVVLFCLFSSVPDLSAQVLFDNTKAETAGNADWIIDTHQPIPSPAITGITAGTAENYWTGALSSWGVALAKLGNAGQISLPGNGLETLPTSGRITYGDSSNSQDLSNYKAFVVCEPNILFTATEKTAILNFVKNGGGLFMVADHTGSDRNNDGSDSLTVWNDLLNNNTVQNNPFGFTFNVDSGTPTATVDSSTSDPMTHGLAGTVTTLKYDVGCTMNLTDNTVAHAAVWESNPSQVMALYGTFGSGRFCAIGDSSVVEDATSSQGSTFAGWTTPVDNGYCVINGMVWLLAAGGASSSSAPSVITSPASNVTTNIATLNGSLNPNGTNTTAKFEYGPTTSYGTTVALAGTFTGTNNIAVNTNLTGLLAGTTYHFRLDATNANGLTLGADQSFTTSNNAVVAGGNFSGVLVAWEVNGLSAYGASPLAASSNAPAVTVVGLTRGSGVGTASMAAGNAWGGTGFVFANEAAAIAGNSFATFSLTAGAGYTMACTNIPAYNVRRSGTGSSTGIWQYQVGGGAFIDLGSAITWGSNTGSTGNAQSPIDLSNISALLNVAAGTTVTFRIVLWGGTGTGGWYINNLATAGYDLQVLGSLTFVVQANTAPVFTAPIAGTNIIINAGSNLVLNCAATDADSPAQTLAYTLLSGPTNASVNVSSGNFLWRPLVKQANSVNPIKVVVTDNGTPNLSATNSFTVTVNPLTLPAVTATSVTGGQFNYIISGPGGPDYTLQYATNLINPAWTMLLATNSPALPFSFTDTNTLRAQTFYRIVIGP